MDCFIHVFSIQNGKDSFGRSNGLLDRAGHVGQLGQGLGELVGILEKSLDIAQADGAVDHVDDPKDGNQEIADIFNKVHQGENHDLEKFRLPGSVKVGVIMLCKSLLFIFFLAKNADDADLETHY